MSGGYRWGPLEARIAEALAQAGEPLDHADLIARLDVINGNEWILAQALADLVADGAVREAQRPDGRIAYLPAE